MLVYEAVHTMLFFHKQPNADAAATAVSTTEHPSRPTLPVVARMVLPEALADWWAAASGDSNPIHM
jgi:hypothetical protein